MSKLNYKNTYWNDKGKYQKEMVELRDKLFPALGENETYHGEVLRCISNIYHDVYNNGGGNFSILLWQRNKIVKFLKENNLYVPDFLYGSYQCDCAFYRDENNYDDDYCECITDVELTQQIIDELEEIANIVIEFCLREENK